MKSFLLFLVISITTLTSCDVSTPIEIAAEQPTECDCNELILDQKYNRFYLTDRKNPFTGRCEIIYPNGKVKTERNYIEGKYHGNIIDYYDNGQIEIIREYETHFINGFEKIFSKDGQLIKHTIYKRSTVVEVVENHPEVLKN